MSDLAKIPVAMPASEGGPYDALVHRGSDGDRALAAELDARFPGRARFVVCDPALRTRAIALSATIGAKLVISEAGETAKQLVSIEQLAGALVGQGIDRESVLCALGGGAIGDSAGFVAATLLRGLDCVQLPTTLLAMVDSSIGGKTAVNLAAGKNLLGAFHQPRLVFADLAWLDGLDPRDRASGLGEVLKHALLESEAALAVVERDAEALAKGPARALFDVVCAAVAYKARVVAADPRELSGERIKLNLGHTVGHALERASHDGDDPLRHGEAVALGLLAEAQLGEKLGHWRGGPARLAALLPRLGLDRRLGPTLRRLSPEVVKTALQADKKKLSGQLRFVLLDAPGRAALVTLDADEAVEMLRAQNVG